ncbi:type III-A CRISPR-associated protein Csm2 [Membranicola marinus]|uniref:CRISPR system Cms protein Csm2 n=1 Tax=Membranihabitans marinus TaxID=1227546 RepID=A0A953LEB8_9BACT|nr:type III-A CRISPR-associated protein Csm2 [Membranihabitans marinus]MBY5959774.1 type III-A CRISPR-associated protein Csm2 [Membranihabitans marinus]
MMNGFKESWITNSIDFETVCWAQNKGKELASGTDQLSTSQLRKFFGELRRIESDYERYKEDIPLLTVKLAYATGRNKKSKIKDFYRYFKEMDKAYRSSDNKKESFYRMVKIIESIVAFHKFSGGN